MANRDTDRKDSSRRAGSGARRSGRKPTPKGGSSPVIDASARNDMYGVALAAVGIALMIAVLSERTGIVARVAAQALKSGVGVGAYVLPILVALWGVTFFVKAFEIHELRVGAGMALVLLSLISMVALAAPVDTVFESLTVQAYGGYIGAAVAWGFSTLFGVTISYVLLAALMLVGLVITGLSISGVVGWATGRLARGSAPAPRETPARPARGDQKTRPLEDDAFDRPAPRPRAETPATDPESRRKTQPTVKPAAPRLTDGFELPQLQLLELSDEPAAAHRATDKELRDTADIIEATLATFDITARVVGWVPGPTVTMFEAQLAKGVKVHRITALSDDLALALAAPTIRILAPIPGKSLVGIEVPNDRRATVTLGDAFAASSLGDEGPLALVIGKDVAGDTVVADLATMPHLLIAGATGTGKSVCINALLMTILMRATPAEVRLILIDPKRIELSLYNGVPHLYVPVVTEPKESASALAWAVSEMDSRLKRLQKSGARNIAQYNAMVHDGSAPEGAEPMSYLVIVIDELADLMMIAAKEVEDSICRLAQLARAAGIHLVVATQRPSADIITGLIKANITNRIAFAVSQGLDSRVILDTAGAEKLVGLGDMLFSTPAWAKPKRIQGAYVSEQEIARVVEHLKAQGEPDYHDEILHLKVSSVGGGVDTGDDDDDPLLWEAADIVVTTGIGSTSLLQRRLKVGYARAGRIMDMLEGKGVVGTPDGSKPREVLCDVEDLQAIKAFERQDGDEGDM